MQTVGRAFKFPLGKSNRSDQRYGGHLGIARAVFSCRAAVWRTRLAYYDNKAPSRGLE